MKIKARIKAIDLYNELKSYSEDELKKLDVVIELGRASSNKLGKSEYANHLEKYPSQLRIINKE